MEYGEIEQWFVDQPSNELYIDESGLYEKAREWDVTITELREQLTQREQEVRALARQRQQLREAGSAVIRDFGHFSHGSIHAMSKALAATDPERGKRE